MKIKVFDQKRKKRKTADLDGPIRLVLSNGQELLIDENSDGELWITTGVDDRRMTIRTMESKPRSLGDVPGLQIKVNPSIFETIQQAEALLKKKDIIKADKLVVHPETWDSIKSSAGTHWPHLDGIQVAIDPTIPESEVVIVNEGLIARNVRALMGDAKTEEELRRQIMGEWEK
jgi:hypothetical protein